MATVTLTIAALMQRGIRAVAPHISDLEANFGRTVDESEAVPLATWWSLPSVSVSDRWLLLRAVEPGKVASRIAIAGSIRAARRVLVFAIGPDREVCTEAIEAAEAVLRDDTPANRERARAAASMARVHRAMAPHSVRAAANAARAASFTAAYAHSAAAYAGYAADAAADSAYCYDTAYLASRRGRAAFAVYADAAEREAQRADLDELLAEWEAQ